MNTINVPGSAVLVVLAALVIGLTVWRSGARRARAAADAAWSGARLVSVTGRVLFNTGLIVGAQWAVTTYAENVWVRLAVLALPALFASYALTKSLAVTTIDPTRRRGGRR